MKKIVNILLIFAIIFAAFGCSAPKASNEGYLLYRSSPVGVEIEYPDFWEMTDSKTERTVAFAAPNEGFADTFRENVTILSEKLGDQDLAFDNFVINYIKKLPGEINNYNKLSENEMTVSEYRAYRVVYEGKTNDGDLRIQHTFIECGDYLYIYTFMAEPASYDYYCKNSDVMLSTFNPLRK